MQIKEKLKGNIILIVLSVVTCVVSLLLIRQTHNHVLLNEKYLLQKINNETFHGVLERNMTSVINTDGVAVSGDRYIYRIYNQKKDSLLMDQLVNSLILFVPQKSCNVCYDEIYDALKYAHDSLNIKYSIITEKGKYNEVRNVIMDLGINMRECTYYLEDSMFWNKISVIYAPFLSYLDDALTCRHSFIPFPNHSKYSYHYLNLLWKRYFFVNKT